MVDKRKRKVESSYSVNVDVSEESSSRGPTEDTTMKSKELKERSITEFCSFKNT